VNAALTSRLPLLMLVTDTTRLRGRALADVVTATVDGGVNCVQLREKTMPRHELLTLAEQLRDITRGRALLLVNTDIDVAARSGADGVHLPEAGAPVADVRRALGERAIVSRAVHRVDAAVAAERDGADFVVFGPAFETPSHPGQPPSGLDALRAACDAVRIPVVAIGGITATNAPLAIDVGARGVAVIGDIFDAADPRVAAAALRRAVEQPARA
jgi:thiamine-phosphate pyrophosphorylase